jgi:hypothetical protein
MHFELTLNLQIFWVNLNRKIFIDLFTTCNFKFLKKNLLFLFFNKINFKNK